MGVSISLNATQTRRPGAEWLSMGVRNVDLVFFSRGRGKGHAIPDLAILQQLGRLLPGCTVTFVSYAVGADVLRAADQDVVDIGLPEMTTFFDTVTRCGTALRSIRARLAVCHEEPGAIVAAKIFGIPAVYLSHWFHPPEYPFSEALEHADSVILMEKEGLFPEPKQVRGRVTYVGPVLRQFHYRRSDRNSVRAELGLGPHDRLILVLPGSPPEDATPIRDLVFGAFRELASSHLQVIWVAGKSFVQVASLAAESAQMKVLEHEPQLDRLMVAADLAITKGTYNIGRELVALGVPSISLSHGYNSIDDLFARTFPVNKFLWAQQTTPLDLARCISESLTQGLCAPDETLLRGSGTEQAAACLATMLLNTRATEPQPRMTMERYGSGEGMARSPIPGT